MATLSLAVSSHLRPFVIASMRSSVTEDSRDSSDELLKLCQLLDIRLLVTMFQQLQPDTCTGHQFVMVSLSPVRSRVYLVLNVIISHKYEHNIRLYQGH